MPEYKEIMQDYFGKNIEEIDKFIKHGPNDQSLTLVNFSGVEE